MERKAIRETDRDHSERYSMSSCTQKRTPDIQFPGNSMGFETIATGTNSRVTASSTQETSDKQHSTSGLPPIATVSPRIKISGSRGMSQQFYMPTSRAQSTASALRPIEGTKSLTSSPLLVTKSRRNGSPLYGSTSHTRDRFSSMYNSQHQGSSLGHATDINPSVQATSGHFIPTSRYRRLSGSQQQALLTLETVNVKIEMLTFQFKIEISTICTKQHRQIQYKPTFIGNTGYRSDSNIDTKHSIGIDPTRVSCLNNPCIAPQSTFATGSWGRNAYQGGNIPTSSLDSDPKQAVSASAFRSANSLESLDSVSNSIQQARANSLSSTASGLKYLNGINSECFSASQCDQFSA